MILLGGEMTRLSNETELELVVDIPPQFNDYLDATLIRLQAIVPECRFSQSNGCILARGLTNISPDRLRTTILHTIYREKIYAETLGIRRDLVAAVTAR